MKSSFKRVALLYGGFHDAKEIGNRNAIRTANHLKEKGYDVVLIDVDFVHIREQILEANVDAIFNLAWGKYAEDGRLQVILDTLNIPYTGSRPEGFLRGRDKLMHKTFLKMDNLPQAEYTMFHKLQTEEEIKKIILDFGIPVILKPSYGGSSIGIQAIFTEDEIIPAIAEAHKHAENTIVERYIKGTEVAANVIEIDGVPTALPLVECVHHIEGLRFIDHINRFDYKTVEYVSPTINVDKEVEEYTKELAVRAFKACGLSGFARLDIMISEKDNKPYILEMNTLPGTGPIMMSAALANGWSYSELAETLLLTARLSDKEKING